MPGGGDERTIRPISEREGHAMHGRAGLLMAGALVLVASIGRGNPPVEGAPGSNNDCFAPTACIAPGCVPVPTSNVPVDVRVTGDMLSAGGWCGTKRVSWFPWARRPCGPPLSAGFCNLPH